MSTVVWAQSAVRVYVNGMRVNEDVILKDGRTYVPLRAVSESIGAEVIWDESTFSAHINFTEDDAIAKIVEDVSPSVVTIIGNYIDSAEASKFSNPTAHGSGVIYGCDLNGVMFSYLTTDLSNANFTKAQAELKSKETQYIKEYGAKKIVGATPKNIGGKQYAYHILELELNGEKVYLHEYAYPANKNQLHVFVVYFPELTYSLGNIKQIENIISTLHF